MVKIPVKNTKMILNSIPNKSRIDLAIMFGELGFKRGAEIGVRTGKFSEILCTHVKGLEKLYSIDPWGLVPEDPISRDYLRKYGAKIFDKIYRQALRRLRKYPTCEMVKKTSLEAVRDFEYGSLDFVYIDGAHTFDYVMVDIIEWAKRVRIGGIISGDDYQPLRKGNVMAAVDTYIQAHAVETLNILQPKEEGRGIAPQWWFIKQ